MSDQQPPERVTLKWCPECGRDDRHVAFGRTKHGYRGEWCTGQPVRLIYGLLLREKAEWPHPDDAA